MSPEYIVFFFSIYKNMAFYNISYKEKWNPSRPFQSFKKILACMLFLFNEGRKKIFYEYFLGGKNRLIKSI